MTEVQDNVTSGINEIIGNSSRTQKLFIDLTKSAESEVLLMLPTVNSFMREYRIGVIQLLEELSPHPEGRTINIRILTPIDNTIKKILEDMKTKTTLSDDFYSDKHYNSNLKIRYLESQSEFNVPTVTILLADRKTSLVIEKVDDSKEEFKEAVLLSTHSTIQCRTSIQPHYGAWSRHESHSPVTMWFFKLSTRMCSS